MDSLKATFTLSSVLPHDLVRVNASLFDTSTDEMVDYSIMDFTINSSGVEKTVTFTMPEGVDEGDYNISLTVYNSTGRINEIVE